MSDNPCTERNGRFFLMSKDGEEIEIGKSLVPLLKPIADIKPDPANPRKTVALKQLVDGIRRFGVRWPVLVNERTGFAEAGHQRYYAQNDELGLSHIPVIYADDDGVTAAAFNIADNRLGETVSKWDDIALGKMLKAISKESDNALDGIGFKAGEIKKLISKMEDVENPSEDIEESPELAMVPVIVNSGEIWCLGKNRLICGDSTKPETFERLFNGEKAKMVFMDPPYNVNYGKTMKDSLRNKNPKHKQHKAIENDNLGDEFRPFLLAMFNAFMPHIDGAMYISMAGAELDALQETFREAGGYWSTFIIWVKQTFTMGMSDYQRQYEPILYGWPKKKKKYWCGARDQADVWFFDRPRNNDLHPTMKPIALVEKAITNSSMRGDLVADAFLGSGTTLLAAERTGRRCNGVEMDPRYCDVICQRYFELSGVSPVREEDGASWVDIAKTQDFEVNKPMTRVPVKEKNTKNKKKKADK